MLPVARPSGLALLLSQVGAHVSARFAERLARHGLTPAQVGVLRVVGQSPGLSQQELGARIGAVPSRVVKLVDELEALGLVERTRSDRDRRLQELRVPPSARGTIADVMATVRDHDREIGGTLTEDERERLIALLRKVAGDHGLGDRH